MEKKLFELIIEVRKKCLQTEEKIRSELNLSPAELHGLLALEPGEKLLGATFSDRMCLSPSRGSRVISRLVQDGYVDQMVVPDNRRSVEVFLTTDGVQMRKNVQARMEECEKRFSSQLNSEQIVNVRSALEALVDVM